MRFLILQNKDAPGWVYDAVAKLATENGHSLVKWTQSITKDDYDGTLCINSVDSFLTAAAEDEINDMIGDYCVIGRGIYEGLNKNLPDTYLIGFNQDESDYNNPVLVAISDLSLEKLSGDNYSEWGKAKFIRNSSKLEDLRVLLRSRMGHTFATAKAGISTGVYISGDKYLLLLMQ